MFRFEHIEYLWALAVIPLVIALYYLHRSRRKSAADRFASRHLIEYLAPGLSPTKPFWQMVFLCASLAGIAVAAAGPQVGTKLEEVKREGVDLIVCIDISKSMSAEDYKPNRLRRAKRAIQKLVDNLKSDRIGMIVFAGRAYVQLPITTDYAAAKLFLDNISTDLINTQGTAIGEAVELAAESFDPESPAGKSIIIISDGEDHEGGAIEAAAGALEKGINVHAIGFGSEKGAPIPLYSGNRQIGFVKDKSGNTVVTKLNAQMLQDIADAGGGEFVRATNSDSGLRTIFEEIAGMETAEYGSKIYTDYENRFQYFLAFALLCFAVYRLIGVKQSELSKKIKASGI